MIILVAGGLGTEAARTSRRHGWKSTTRIPAMVAWLHSGATVPRLKPSPHDKRSDLVYELVIQSCWSLVVLPGALGNQSIGKHWGSWTPQQQLAPTRTVTGCVNRRSTWNPRWIRSVVFALGKWNAMKCVWLVAMSICCRLGYTPVVKFNIGYCMGMFDGTPTSMMVSLALVVGDRYFWWTSQTGRN